MKEIKIVIKNKLGLHAKTAATFVECISRYSSDVTIIKEGNEVDGKSLLSILTLYSPMGTEWTVRAVGEDADAVLSAVKELAERNFYE